MERTDDAAIFTVLNGASKTEITTGKDYERIANKEEREEGREDSPYILRWPLASMRKFSGRE